MSWVPVRDHTWVKTLQPAAVIALRNSRTRHGVRVVLTRTSAYIMNLLVERNVPVFVVAVLATIRWAGLNHSDCTIKPGGNLRGTSLAVSGGSTLYPPQADTQRWTQRWQPRVEHVGRTARFDWLLVPSSNLDKVHQGGLYWRRSNFKLSLYCCWGSGL